MGLNENENEILKFNYRYKKKKLKKLIKININKQSKIHINMSCLITGDFYPYIRRYDLSGIKWIHIKNDAVRDGNINPRDFCVLLALKLFSYDGESEKDSFQIDNRLLRYWTNINDNVTLKKSFKNLYTHGYIKNEITTLIQNRPTLVELNMNKIKAEKGFTRVPIKLLEMLRDNEITHAGVRLIYYYESMISRSDSRKDFCYPSEVRICSETGIKSPKTVSSHNELLKKLKLIKITNHRLESHGYSIDGDHHNSRFNNHYEVRLDPLINM